jgi:hypothetical protein
MPEEVRKINLQLFADDEEEVEIEEEIEEEVEAEETETETEAETEKEPEKPVKKDKVTAAIIREKQENKKLRDELAEYRRKEEERARVKADSELKQKYIEDGLSEEEADDRIADRRERQELKTELKRLKYGKEADKLESKYPDIHAHLDSFISIVEASKGTITITELCKAKLDKSSEFEKKTKLEQEAILTKGREKQIKTGEVKTDSPVKLSADDERILANINKKKQAHGLPLMSKKQYLELSI